MAGKSINLNHVDASITSNDGTFIHLNKNGAVKVGYGINAEESTINNDKQETLFDYKGVIRFNRDTNKLEFCNGLTWLEISTEKEDDKTPMVYSMLF